MTSLITSGFGIQQFVRIARLGAPESKGVIGPNGFDFTMMIIIGVLALFLATLDRWRTLALHARYPAKSGIGQERVPSRC